MAWSRRVHKGWHSIDPISPIKQPSDLTHISATGQIDSLVNHKSKPGDYGWDDLDDVYFSAENILYNGDFEITTLLGITYDDSADANLLFWFNYGTHDATNHFTISDTGGSNRLNIVRGSGDSMGAVYQNILTSEGTYTYSVDIHTIGPGFKFYTFNADFSEAISIVSFPPSVGNVTKTGTITVAANATNFVIAPNTVDTGTTKIDNIILTPDNKHIPDGDTDDDGDTESDEGVEAGEGTFNDVIISTWFRDDGSTTT